MCQEYNPGADAFAEELRHGAVGRGQVREIVPNGVYDTAAAGMVLHRSARWVAKKCAEGLIDGVNNNGWRMSGKALLAFLKGK